MIPACCPCFFFFFFNDTAPTEIYPLSLHDALPIFGDGRGPSARGEDVVAGGGGPPQSIARPTRSSGCGGDGPRLPLRDRKSTRLNSSHVRISYAVFCLKKKKRPPHNAAVRCTAQLT